jgi:hypothetical protein
MALSLAMAGLGLVLAEIGLGQGRGPRLPRWSLAPRRAVRRVCSGCERQRARFRDHGLVTWDRYHALCLRCLRAHAGKCRMR